MNPPALKVLTAAVLLAGGFLAAACGDASAAPVQANAQPRVAIAFVPGPPPQVKPAMIDRLAAIRMPALGFMSAILGSYFPEQTLLDISAGARTWTSLYERDLPDRMVLSTRGGGGSIAGWPAALERASTPPAEVVPGALGEAVRAGAGRVAYVGPAGASNREAIAAADRAGRIPVAVLARPREVAATALRLWRGARLLVVRLPAGPAGLSGAEALVRSRRAHDLVLVVQEPTAVGRRLLAVGAAGLSGNGLDMRSNSTRTDGLVVSTDIAPTVLGRLGIPVPAKVAGQPIERSGDRSVAQLNAMRDRLAQIGPRRWSVVLAGFAGAVLLVAAASLITGTWLRGVARGACLAALWMPVALLVTGALAPSRLSEIAISGAGAGVLAVATDRVAPWPRSLALPAAVTVIAHMLDLALGSAWIARSLLGPNPLLGARYYGIGNELEITLAVIGLLGLGALLANAPPRSAIWGFVLGGGTLAALMSWGRLGADVGATLTLAAGTAAAAVLALDDRPRRARLLLAVAAPALALAALAALDLATGGNSHFTRSVLRAGGLHELGDIAQRKLELSYHSLGRGIVGALVVLALAALALSVRYRRRLLSPLEPTPALRAAIQGAAVAVVVGALANDSGPIIILIGTSYLALATGYFWAMPNARHIRRAEP